MNTLLKLLIYFIIIILAKHLFLLFKINDLKIVDEKTNFIDQKLNNYTDIVKQHGPININDTLEYGIYRIHPFSHPNDFDIQLAEIRNNMTILDCGCGVLGTEERLLQLYPNLNIHVISNTNKKYKIKIINKIKKLEYSKKIKTHFIDFNDMSVRFDEIKFDRILFIESLSYNKNIQKILRNSFKILNNNGKIYIRTITAPKTKSLFISNNILNMEQKMQCNLIYHENILYFLQQAGFKNIKFSSIPLILSENFVNPIFYVPLLRYKLLNLNNFYTTLSLSVTMYVGEKNNI